jgi:hypothetical protein
MGHGSLSRHLVTFRREGALALEDYYARDLKELARTLLGDGLVDDAELVDRPTRAWLTMEQMRAFPEVPFLCSFEIRPAALASVAERLREMGANGFGTDAEIDVLGHWCPVHAGGGAFGDSDGALAVCGISALHEKGWKGGGANVVVVDKGIDPASLPPGVLAGVWFRRDDGSVGSGPEGPPLKPDVAAHGTMIARLVHLAAPEAKIWDLRGVVAWTGSTAFLADTLAAYTRAAADIDTGATGQGAGQRWVFVNPWGMWDTRGEKAAGSSSSPYSSDPNHPFTSAVSGLAQRFDIVFAAGNCGALCPSTRCGPGDRGPGRSILGANGAEAVTSVGATRIDGVWLGYSAQGPSALGAQKVDLCAPSHFRRAGNHAEPFTGTSAASAIVAGAMACLRSQAATPAASPSVLRQRLRDKASKATAGWDDRLGHGVLQVSDVSP